MARKLKAGFVRINGGGLDNTYPSAATSSRAGAARTAAKASRSFTEIKSVTIAL